MSDSQDEMPVSMIKTLEKNMLSCIDKFSKCVQTKTKDEIIKAQIKEVNKQRLEFHKFAEKSIEYIEILSNYIIEFQSIIEMIKNETISNKELIEELEILLSATEIADEALKELNEQINYILENFFEVNNVLKKYRVEIENNYRNIKSETAQKLNATENDKRARGGNTIIGMFLAMKDIIKISSLEKELKKERDGLQPTLTNQKETLNGILKKMKTPRNSKYEIINGYLEKLKPELKGYNFSVRALITKDKMINDNIIN
ncbi:19919_t:CDS:2, partial [Cetraspora pellucida]